MPVLRLHPVEDDPAGGGDCSPRSRRVNQLAGSASDEPDFGPVATRIRDEATDDWNDQVAVDRLEGKGATIARGAGRLAGRAPDGRLQVQVGDDTHTAAAVCVSTGTAPAMPPIDGLADLPRGVDDLVWTNREIVKTRTAPRSMVVVGGGAIGCELAQGFARFGTSVTLIEGAPHLLMPEEPEAGEVVAEVLRPRGDHRAPRRRRAVGRSRRRRRGRDAGRRQHRDRREAAGRGRPHDRTCPTSGSRRSGSTRRRAISTSTSTCRSTAWTGVFAIGDVTGKAAVHARRGLAGARCWPPTSWARTNRTAATTEWPGRPSPSPRSAGSG